MEQRRVCISETDSKTDADMTVQGSSRYGPAHNIIHQSETIYDREEPK